MVIVLLLLGAVIALVLGGVMIYSIATGEVPRPQKIVTGITRTMRAFSSTLGYGSHPRRGNENKSRD